jgi:hypothetical protein
MALGEYSYLDTTMNSTVVQHTIVGSSSVTPSADCYLGSANLGLYTMAIQDQPDWEFSDLQVAAGDSLSYAKTKDPKTIKLASNFNGWGNLTTQIIKLGATSAVTNFTVRIWANIEYQPNTDSIAYDYARGSPSFDPIAIQGYRNSIQSIPIAVPVYENATFWATLWKWINPVTTPLRKFANYIPGPLGVAATGVNTLLDGLK